MSLEDDRHIEVRAAKIKGARDTAPGGRAHRRYVSKLIQYLPNRWDPPIFGRKAGTIVFNGELGTHEGTLLAMPHANQNTRAALADEIEKQSLRPENRRFLRGIPQFQVELSLPARMRELLAELEEVEMNPRRSGKLADH